MEEISESYVSIVGDSYLLPIADLSETLFSHASLSQNEVQASSWENGYSASLCILTIAWFESYTILARYLNWTSGHTTIKQPVSFLKARYPDLPIFDELVEIFVLRDTLIHNHLWMIQFSSDESVGMKLHEADKDAFSGDKKYAQYVDTVTRKTKKLGLNVVPTKVCNTDFKIVLKMIWHGFLFIQEKDPSRFGITNGSIKFKNKFLSRQQFVDQICK